MRIKQLRIDRHEYGNDKGKLYGSITIEGQSTETKMNLDEFVSQQIIELVADGVRAEAARLSNIMVGELLEVERAPALPASAKPGQVELDDEIPF